ncbi:hypothetical protein CROQUDRAFT_86941 [Cronartium quercuum f. sp. fusiforme G11]|uniref:Uncharacterized protein n=1 Tax=Cronartium quercuum f. sp. fusiforme G11 TaxID=708437 RepID=A0A9P6TFX8_9BASI|nr:hypothetical protein CROQUDRAFT_86941 [Cronartium quercuum f. sp. fusiforme G11]
MYNPTEVGSALEKLARQDAAAIPETTEHFLLLFNRYCKIHQHLIKALLKLKIPQTMHAILTNPKAFKPLANFICYAGYFRRTTANKLP